MSTPDQWRDRCTLKKQTASGVDPNTHLLVKGSVLVFKDLICDLSIFKRRTAVEGPNGTRYVMVEVHQLKIWPPKIEECPDEDDDLEVNGVHYRVESVEHFYDGGSGSYRGSRLILEAPEAT